MSEPKVGPTSRNDVTSEGKAKSPDVNTAMDESRAKERAAKGEAPRSPQEAEVAKEVAKEEGNSGEPQADHQGPEADNSADALPDPGPDPRKTKRKTEIKAGEARSARDEEALMTERAKRKAIEASTAHMKRKVEPHALYVSSAEEPVGFSIMVGRAKGENVVGKRMTNGHVVWQVPLGLVEQFERHQFVRTGRIVRTE